MLHIWVLTYLLYGGSLQGYTDDSIFWNKKRCVEIMTEVQNAMPGDSLAQSAVCREVEVRF